MADETSVPTVAPATPVEAPGLAVSRGVPTQGRSQTYGLQELPDSLVPGLPNGGMVSHVMGPNQAPCDPVAAGLDMGYHPVTRAENRAITRTGQFASGQPPSTYAHTGVEVSKPPEDHSIVAAQHETVSASSPGPNSVDAVGAAPTAETKPAAPAAERSAEPSAA